MAPSDLKPAYLFVGTGQGDTQVALMTKDVWDWAINTPMRAGRSGWIEFEECPPLVQAMLVKQAEEESRSFGAREAPGVSVTSGSAINDRLLAINEPAALFYAYGDSSDIVAAHRWAGANGYTIVETYDGYIY